MKRFLLSAALCALFASAAFADSLLPDSKAANGDCTPGTSTATLTLPDGRKMPMAAVGHGLRKKGLLPAYCATFFVDTSTATPAYQNAIASNDQTGAAEIAVFSGLFPTPTPPPAVEPAAAMRLDIRFFATTPGKDAASDFKGGLEKNMDATTLGDQIAADSGSYAQFLDQVTGGGNNSKGSSLIVAFDFNKHQLIFQGANGTIQSPIVGDDQNSFLINVLKIWFGVTDGDGGLTSLKSSLLTPPSSN